MKPFRNVIEIKIDKIKIINPRERDPARFEENVASIQRLGLKRPIVVNTRFIKEHGMYELVCGQGRIEAYQKLSFDTIPSLAVDVDRETALIMSIAENATRSTPPPIWFAQVIKGFADTGMPIEQIALILDRPPDKIRQYLQLISKGDKILIEAVERGTVSVSSALAIIVESDGDLQALLTRGIENRLFDFSEIPAVRKLIHAKMKFYQDNAKRAEKPKYQNMTLDDLRKEIKKTLDKQEEFIRKSRRHENQLLVLTEDLKRLFADNEWITLLQSNGLDNYPKLNGVDYQDFFSQFFTGNEL